LRFSNSYGAKVCGKRDSEMSNSMGRISAVILVISMFLANFAFAKGPVGATPETAIEALLQAGLDQSFDAYLAVLLPSERENPMQIAQRKSFDWKRFKDQATWYVDGNKAATFKIARKEPQGADKLKIFLKDLKHPSRMPVPLHLVREKERWWVKSQAL